MIGMDKNQILKKLTHPNQELYFILDIDSTLVSTHQRNQKIILDFCSENSLNYPVECQQLKNIQCQNGDYGFKSALIRMNFKSQTENFSKILDQYWRERFFSNHYLYLDQPNPGAVDWVKGLESQKISFTYLTARHHSTMWSGTLTTMAQMGFPISEKNLFLKMDKNEKDEIYKVKTLENLKAEIKNKEIIFVDNEPVVLCQLKKDFKSDPPLSLVWFNSCHSGRMTAPEEALEISDFIF